MWHRILIATVLCLAGINGEVSYSVEQPRFNLFSQIHDDITNKEKDFQEIKMSSPQKIIERANFFDDSGQIIFEKRGFSVLARWKHLNNIGKQRTSIRDIRRPTFPLLDREYIASEGGNFIRPLGQPLRWG